MLYVLLMLGWCWDDQKECLSLQVRGANYLRDKKKIPAAEPAFSLAATYLMQVEQPTFHIARFLPSLRSEHFQSSSPPPSELDLPFRTPLSQ